MTPVIALVGLLASASPDVQGGRQLFNDPGLGKNGVACATCHAVVRNEAEDGDGRIRSGQTLWGVAQRPFWRGDRGRRLHRNLGSAVDVCVQLFQGGRPLTGRRRRQLRAYLRQISPPPRKKQRRRAPDSPRIRTALEADLDYDRPHYQNGDAKRGRGLFYRACHQCHPHGRAGVAPAIAGASVADVAKAVREGNGLLRGARRAGAWSPFYGLGRLSHRQVADIAAFVSTLQPKR